MPRNFSTQLAGQIGESLVVAELGRRGIVATAFAGNVPDIDLLAYRGGKSLHLQVKAWRSGSVSTNATRFLDIVFDGERQIVNGLVDGLDEELVFVFVNIGATAGQDKFYIVKQGDLARNLMTSYSDYLAKHGGIRPRNPETTHSSIDTGYLENYEENWPLIEEYFKHDEG